MDTSIKETVFCFCIMASLKFDFLENIGLYSLCLLNKDCMYNRIKNIEFLKIKSEDLKMVQNSKFKQK